MTARQIAALTAKQRLRAESVMTDCARQLDKLPVPYSAEAKKAILAHVRGMLNVALKHYEREVTRLLGDGARSDEPLH